MNKTMRLVLIVAVLVCTVIAAGSQTAWASKPAASVAAPAAAAQGVEGLTTVIPPAGCGSQTPVDETLSTLCGVATIVSDNAKLIGTSYLGARPDGFKNKKVLVTLWDAGSASLCFVARSGGTIYFYDTTLQKWTPIFTTVTNGIACAQITQSGEYVLGK